MIKVIFLSRISSLIRKFWLLGRRESRDRMREEAKVVRDRTVVGGYYRILRGRQGVGVKNDPLSPGGHAGFALEVLKWRSI